MPRQVATEERVAFPKPELVPVPELVPEPERAQNDIPVDLADDSFARSSMPLEAEPKVSHFEPVSKTAEEVAAEKPKETKRGWWRR